MAEHKTNRRQDTVNPDRLFDELSAVDPGISGFRSEGGIIIVTAANDLSEAKVQQALAIVANHQAAMTAAQIAEQERAAARATMRTLQAARAKYQAYYVNCWNVLLMDIDARRTQQQRYTNILAALKGNANIADDQKCYADFVYELEQNTGILSNLLTPMMPAGQFERFMTFTSVFIHRGLLASGVTQATG